MRPALLFATTAAVCGLSLAAPARADAQDPWQPPRRTLQPFRSDSDFVRFNRRIQQEYEQRVRSIPRPSPVMPPPPPAMMSPAPSAPQAQGASAARAAESITNVQHAGVDEGGIVKVHGDYLVILRRGRLFTVRVGDDALQPVSATDAFGPGIDPQGAWYDELLVSGDQVVVIGYSYRRGGTEVGLFRITPDGRLAHRSTWQLRSADYYSSRNYASRLVGGKLVFYAPLPVRMSARDPFAGFPAFRRWGAADSAWRRTAAATRVYRPAGELSVEDGLTLHTVTSCDMGGAELDCRSTAVYGPRGRVFYVSPRSVYVWTTQNPRRGDNGDGPPRSAVYRLPLDGSAPTGLRTAGAPIDQMSFLESGDGHLNVLVRSMGRGDGMWGAERTAGGMALLRVRVSRFGDGREAARSADYRPLPSPEGASLQNRYVGDWLLYGAGSGWRRAQTDTGSVFAVRWAGGGDAVTLSLPHVVDRIESMGSGAVVVGTGGRDLHFSGVRLGRAATLAHRYVRANASQGETRTHGFFYRPDGDDEGVLGLPVRGPGRPGYSQLTNGSASVLFLRNRAFRLTELGDLAAEEARAANDACKASCVDWYGNARPIFLRGRIFALLGYELVEGREDDGRIRELRRVNFAPRATERAEQ